MGGGEGQEGVHGGQGGGHGVGQGGQEVGGQEGGHKGQEGLAVKVTCGKAWQVWEEFWKV